MLLSRIQEDPFNLFSTLIFLCAIIHTMFIGKFASIFSLCGMESRNEIIKKRKTFDVALSAQVNKIHPEFKLFHYFVEVELVFGIWIIPLIGLILCYYDWGTLLIYLKNIHYSESIFVIVVMSVASTLPVIRLAENCLQFIALTGSKTPASWWFSILLIAPILGSFITEPAAMTIAAFLLGKQFYNLNPSKTLKYATLGLLFTNISIGGTLTEFAAPPVLMMSTTWHWDMISMFTYFGWKAMMSIAISTLSYYFVFRKEFLFLIKKSENSIKSIIFCDKDLIPLWVYLIHVLFLAWTVFTLQDPVLFIGGFLFFLAFVESTDRYQTKLKIRNPLMVGFFLSTLVTHGGLQRWWIEPVLNLFGELSLFSSAVILTTFNDNAAITYLASLVPEFSSNAAMQHAVVAGALSGGGLTVIANAPNPAGQSILNPYFKNKISPFYLICGAFYPTIITSLCFTLLPNL